MSKKGDAGCSQGRSVTGPHSSTRPLRRRPRARPTRCCMYSGFMATCTSWCTGTFTHVRVTQPSSTLPTVSSPSPVPPSSSPSHRRQPRRDARAHARKHVAVSRLRPRGHPTHSRACRTPALAIQTADQLPAETIVDAYCRCATSSTPCLGQSAIDFVSPSLAYWWHLVVAVVPWRPPRSRRGALRLPRHACPLDVDRPPRRRLPRRRPQTAGRPPIMAYHGGYGDAGGPERPYNGFAAQPPASRGFHDRPPPARQYAPRPSQDDHRDDHRDGYGYDGYPRQHQAYPQLRDYYGPAHSGRGDPYPPRSRPYPPTADHGGKLVSQPAPCRGSRAHVPTMASRSPASHGKRPFRPPQRPRRPKPRRSDVSHGPQWLFWPG